ncbi:hypothetical protein C8Q77DRAFT_1062474 [Trametes polyzona]|nr:hypothetical protein C8Q77DRAFT_1062474 [Trametes polyzona]
MGPADNPRGGPPPGDGDEDLPEGPPGGGGGGGHPGGGPPGGKRPPGRGGGGGGGGPPGGGGPLGPLSQENIPGQANPGHKSKVREPEIFTGDRSKAGEFLTDLQLLFLSCPGDYLNDNAKIVSTLSYMQGETHWWAESKVETTVNNG